MRRIVCITCLLSLCCQSLVGQSDFLSLQKRIQELFQRYEGAVVRVKAYHIEPKETDDSPPKITLRVGTGFFISREGLLLVNASRVKGSKRVTIEHRGTDYLAEILGMDEQVNIALLKATYLPDEFDFLRMNESPTLPEPGTLGLAITCPLTFAPTPKLAMISGQDTKFLDTPFPTTYLRIDTPLNHGEGGGPIIDLQGRLIGMLLASIRETNSSFALPAKAINKIKDDLLLEGRVSYTSIGIKIGQHFFRGGESHVKVTQVEDGSPAQTAGIQVGDVVVRLGDYAINDFSDVPNAMFFIRVGEYVDIEVERESEKITFNVPTIRRPDEEPFIKIEPMTPEEVEKARAEQHAANQPGTDSVEPETSESATEEVATIEQNTLSMPLSSDDAKPGPQPDQ